MTTPAWASSGAGSQRRVSKSGSAMGTLILSLSKSAAGSRRTPPPPSPRQKKNDGPGEPYASVRTRAGVLATELSFSRSAHSWPQSEPIHCFSYGQFPPFQSYISKLALKIVPKSIIILFLFF